MSDLALMARRFTEAWAAPTADRLVGLLAEDVRLIQPVTPEIRGRAAARGDFARLIAWLPDIHGKIDSWSASGDTLLVAWHLCFTLGSRAFAVPIVDRIVVENDLIRERQAYFDPLPFLLATLVRPHHWLGFFRYRGFV